MDNNLSIKGFKCFSNEKFYLKNMTILTGNNGTGKSTVIQALLLIRSAIENNLKESNNSNYTSKTWKGYPTPLNLGYELNLGTIYDVFNTNKSSTESASIKLDNEVFDIKFLKSEQENFSVDIVLQDKSIDSIEIPFWRKREFYYLHTERLGPRFELTSKFLDFVHCGYRGEYTAQVLLNNQFFQVEKQRRKEKSKAEYLPQQVDEWLKYISPGATVKSVPVGTFNAQLRLGNSSSKTDVLSTNYGFGISYSLPIIVTGLIAEKGSIFIVENPEAHMHPKGQSNIGYFLAKVAASGVKILIETHSEHVVNGIRRAIMEELGLKAADAAIYFFNNFDQKENRIKKIEIHDNGDLSDFPVDFFDQVRQDLMAILKNSGR
ncbi:MAG: DUF3696 domain-containing protein [bacterium]